ncbi:MAG: cupredoxin domain-containing protein [Ferruginibacter sp.]
MKSLSMKLLYAVVFLVLLNVSCSKSDNNPGTGGGGGGATSTPVSILVMSYSPSTVTVKTGTVVKWTNTDATSHTVTSDNGTTFSSGNIAAGAVFNYTTAATGNFPYHCTIHGVLMAGTLVVTP